MESATGAAYSDVVLEMPEGEASASTELLCMRDGILDLPGYGAVQA